jgi:S1-C subfamily serine protease
MWRLICSFLIVTAGAQAQPLPAQQAGWAPIVNPAVINPFVRSPSCVGPMLYTRARAATVEVLTDGRLDGTGFIIAPDGRFITAAHVVEQPRKRIEARTIHGRVEARLLALDLGHDLALMQLDPPPTGAEWPALPIAAHPPEVMRPLYLLGTPIFRHHVLLQGMVARDLPTYEYMPDLHRYISIVHLSAPSPAGTSGGPWMNERGEVVGVQSGMMTSRGNHVGIAYMSPLPAIQALVRRGVDANTAWAGLAVEELWEQPRDFIS